MDDGGKHTLDEMLAAYLASNDAPCPGCGYNLRGLAGTRCPECDEELRLRVELVEPKIGAFITGLVGLAMGLGANVFLLIWVGVLLASSGAGPPAAEVWPLPLNVLVGGGAMWGWVASRGRLRRAARRVRWGLVAGCWGLSVVLMLIFVMNVS